MSLLTLDLGTKTGWAFHAQEGTESATELLATLKERKASKEEHFDRRLDPRFTHLLDFLAKEFDGLGDLNVIFEDVLFSEYTLQTQLWSALRAAVWAFAHSQRDCQIFCLNTASLKSFATGNGAATKKMMAAHLLKKHSDLYRKLDKPDEKKNLFLQKIDSGAVVDDNEVDALHLLDYGREILKLS